MHSRTRAIVERMPQYPLGAVLRLTSGNLLEQTFLRGIARLALPAFASAPQRVSYDF